MFCWFDYLWRLLLKENSWQQRQRPELHGTHFPVWLLFLVFISFSLLWIVLVLMICFRLVPFLKAILGSMLKVFLQLWFACNMCQHFVISFKFGNARLYVTDKGVHWVGQPSAFAVCHFFVSFINKLFNRFSRVTVVVLECWPYLLNSKCLAVGNTFL